MSTVFDYTKEERFAVVRKLEKNRRYYCNFKALFTTRDDAEASARKLSNEFKGTFYVIEIQKIAVPRDGMTRLKASDKPVKAEVSA